MPSAAVGMKQRRGEEPPRLSPSERNGYHDEKKNERPECRRRVYCIPDFLFPKPQTKTGNREDRLPADYARAGSLRNGGRARVNKGRAQSRIGLIRFLARAPRRPEREPRRRRLGSDRTGDEIKTGGDRNQSRRVGTP